MSGQASNEELDARMLQELREWRRSPSVVREIERGRQVWLDPEELDLLLRIAAERDALKRASVAEWEADLPEEIRQRIAETWPCLVCGVPIRRRFPKHEPVPIRELGRAYYEHVDTARAIMFHAAHDAVRGPDPEPAA